MKRWMRRLFWIGLILSILLHVVIALFVVFFKVPVALTPQAPIEVFDANNGMNIVDQMTPANRLRPKVAKNLGLEDNAVTQETVARPQPERRPTGQRSAQSPQIPGAPAEQPPTQAPETKSQLKRQRQAAQPRLPFNKNNLYAVDPRLFTMKDPKPNRNMPRTAVFSTMNSDGDAYLPEDYLPDYPYAGHTYVNVFKHPDVDYFVRLKRAFRLTWNPIPAVQNYLSAGGVRRPSIAVVMAVSVDAQGNLAELFVLRSSGSAGYDDEGLRTVRASSPFSAPPDKILKNGLIRMAWTFIVYM